MRLIKLAMLALFGYALYEFLRGMLQDTQLGSRMGEAFGQLTQGQGGGGQQGPRAAAASPAGTRCPAAAGRAWPNPPSRPTAAPSATRSDAA
jgi:hypothetical protein